MLEIVCRSENETAASAAKLAPLIKPPLTLALTGDLGAGKTFFTAALVKSLGSAAAVSSPTFSLMNIYSCTDFKIYHFDLYRLTDEQELEGFGFFEYLDERRTVKIIEWADKFPNALPDDYLEIKFSCSERCLNNENNPFPTALSKEAAAQGAAGECNEIRILNFEAHGEIPSDLLKGIEKIAGSGD